MGPMMAHLKTHRELGLLHADSYVYWRGAALVQYWRSFEQLERFAREPAVPSYENPGSGPASG
jgi:hypothetical protein